MAENHVYEYQRGIDDELDVENAVVRKRNIPCILGHLNIWSSNGGTV